MAATYNFGMLTAGLPDLAQRQVSNPIVGEDYFQGQQNDWLKAWQPKWDAATPKYVQTSAGGWSGGDAGALQAAVNASSGAGGTGYQADASGAYSQGLISAAQAGDASAQGIIGAFGGSYGTYTAPTGYYDDSARKTLEAERDRQNAQFAAATQGRVQNQQAQQSAYNQSNGGTYLGGVLNGSYSQPFGGAPVGTTPTEDGTTVANPAQPWGSPAYGGPMGGQSQAGFGGSGWGDAQPAGWGGPFTNKNPWAAS